MLDVDASVVIVSLSVRAGDASASSVRVFGDVKDGCGVVVRHGGEDDSPSKPRTDYPLPLRRSHLIELAFHVCLFSCVINVIDLQHRSADCP